MSSLQVGQRPLQRCRSTSDGDRPGRQRRVPESDQTGDFQPKVGAIQPGVLPGERVRRANVGVGRGDEAAHGREGIEDPSDVLVPARMAGRVEEEAMPQKRKLLGSDALRT